MSIALFGFDLRVSDPQPEFFRGLPKDRKKNIERFLLSIVPRECVGEWEVEFLDSEILLRSSYRCFDGDGKPRGLLPFQVFVNPRFQYRIHFQRAVSNYVPLIRICLDNDLQLVFTDANANIWDLILANKYSPITQNEEVWGN